MRWYEGRRYSNVTIADGLTSCHYDIDMHADGSSFQPGPMGMRLQGTATRLAWCGESFALQVAVDLSWQPTGRIHSAEVAPPTIEPPTVVRCEFRFCVNGGISASSASAGLDASTVGTIAGSPVAETQTAHMGSSLYVRRACTLIVKC